MIFLISFFRIPKRQLITADDSVIAPADGKVVVIEETEADEYFQDRRIQVSIFMSPLNVHVNRNPVSGDVMYSEYHKGIYYDLQCAHTCCNGCDDTQINKAVNFALTAG